MPKPFYTENEPANLSSLLLYEIDAQWSRELKKIAATDVLIPMGTVLESSADGLIPWAGTNAPVGLALADIQINSTAQEAAVLVRGAIVAKTKLLDKDGAVASAALEGLATLSIFSR